MTGTDPAIRRGTGAASDGRDRPGHDDEGRWVSLSQLAGPDLLLQVDAFASIR
jgi:hypothetical protein